MRLVALAAAAVLLAPSAGPAQITAGQLDDFEDGVKNWLQGALGAPALVPDGGPAGAGDQYMRLTSTGGVGAGSRLTVLNRTQWRGNYIAAGVTAVEMDLLAPTASNAQPLSIRIAFKSGTLQSDPGYVSTTAFTLANDGQWHRAVFQLSASTMTAVGTPAPFNDLMTNPAETRILHSAAPDLNGDVVAAVVGVDNIRALPVPEPAGVLAAAGVVVGLARVVARRRRVARRFS